jgi:hypothetical protein
VCVCVLPLVTQIEGAFAEEVPRHEHPSDQKRVIRFGMNIHQIRNV